MVLISLFGFIISYRKHWCLYPLIIAVPSVTLIFYTYLFSESDDLTILIYLGMFGLLAATGVNYYRNKLHNNYISRDKIGIKELKSTITCPKCAYKKEETMPEDACQFFYECENCKEVVKPQKGDCCVYCSYGNVKCPSKQEGLNCC